LSNNFSSGESESRMGVGKRLIRKMVMRKASSQNISDMNAWARRATPLSTMWHCFLSENPFCG
jgi:hypothetical protein